MNKQQSYYKPQVPLDSESAIVQRLAVLRHTLESGGVDLYEGETPPLLVLSDVCQALGISAVGREVVLSRDGASQVDAWLGLADISGMAGGPDAEAASAPCYVPVPVVA